jgi:hypothetical protein
VLAAAGWALTGQSNSRQTPWATAEFVEVDGGVRVPKGAVRSYPVVPAEDETEQDLLDRADEVAATSDYLDDAGVVGQQLGDPAAGGQVFVQIDAADRTDSGQGDPFGSSGLPEEVPIEVLEAAPFLHPLIDRLTADRDLGVDRFTALDICAGMTPGATPPAGCPPGGFGGTIVPFSLEVLDPVRIVLGTPDAHPECRSDDTTFRMRVVTNRPGRLRSIMWNIGPGTGNTLRVQPPDAVVTFSTTPADLDTQWYEDLDESSVDTPRIRFCMEVPIRVEEGTVKHAVFLTSAYEPDDDDELGFATGGFLHTGSNERRRPRSGLTSIGRDTLYVRAFRDSSQGTRTVVQARRRVPVASGELMAESAIEGCDPSFDGATPTRPTGLGTQAIAMDTYSIDTSGDDWPWGREWDALDVHALPLHGSIGYSVCIYELDAADRVVYAEAADVWVPWTRIVRVFVDGVFTSEVSPEPAISSATFVAAAQSQCRPYVIDWPGPNVLVVEFVGTGSPEVCLFQHTDGLVTNGGFPFEISLARAGTGDVDTVQHWISIPRTELRCPSDCGAGEFVVTVPMPFVTSDGTESSSGEAQLRVVLLEPGGIEAWRFDYPFPFISDS